MNCNYIAVGIIVAVLAAVFHSGYVFTRKLPEEPSEATDCIVAMVRYGYIWIIILLFVCVVPFIFLHDRGFALYQDAPINVIKGCMVADLKSSEGKPDKQCDDAKMQWWFNIGGLSKGQGSLVPEDKKKTIGEAIKAMNQAIAAMNMVLGENSELTPDVKKQLKQAIAAINTVLDKDSELTPDVKKQLEQAIAAIKTVQGNVSELKQDVNKQLEQALRDLRAQISDHFVISGGLSVPLYMIILALLGGLISMTRRIPEFQKRGSQCYKNTYQACLKEMEAKGTSECKNIDIKNFPLEPERVREYVIFQMMQVATAPLLAAAAYALIDLETTSSIVAVGFISGFASESVLVQIRKAADAITGQFPKTAPGKAKTGGSPKAGNETETSDSTAKPKSPEERARIANEAADKSKR